MPFRKAESIIATDVDFAIMRGERAIRAARWDDVERVRAYKRDELTADLICLDVELRDASTWSLHEEAPGWEDFLHVAERALPGMRPFQSWFAEISRPAFGRNETLLFERGAAEQVLK
jgi:hypothetical protein